MVSSANMAAHTSDKWMIGEISPLRSSSTRPVGFERYGLIS